MKCFQLSADNLEKWLRSVGTDPTLAECIMVFVRSRDAQRFSQCVAGYHDPVLTKMARSQDEIGWRRFMEGMILKEFCKMQATWSYFDEYALPADKWAQGLSINSFRGKWFLEGARSLEPLHFGLPKRDDVVGG